MNAEETTHNIIIVSVHTVHEICLKWSHLGRPTMVHMNCNVKRQVETIIRTFWAHKPGSIIEGGLLTGLNIYML